MKNLVLVFFCFVVVASCENQEEKINKVANDTGNYTTIHWIDSVKNIGSVNAGTKININFKFENTGTKPLFVIAARPGCGCTVADYPKEAILPGAEGMVTAQYNAPTGTEGEFRKNISVITNTNGTTNHNIFFYGRIRK